MNWEQTLITNRPEESHEMIKMFYNQLMTAALQFGKISKAIKKSLKGVSF